MAVTGAVSGTIRVGEPNAPDVTITISPTTGTITQYQRGKLLTAGAGPHTIPMGGVTKAELVWLKAYVKATGLPIRVVITITDNTGAVVLDETNELLRNCYGSATGVSAVTVTMPDATEYVVESLVVGT